MDFEVVKREPLESFPVDEEESTQGYFVSLEKLNNLLIGKLESLRNATEAQDTDGLIAELVNLGTQIKVLLNSSGSFFNQLLAKIGEIVSSNTKVELVDLTAILESIEALGAKQPKKWRFEIKRDADENIIEIVAKEI